MEKKTEKLIELKKMKDTYARKLYLVSVAFAIPFIWIVGYSHRFIPSFESTGRLFPQLTTIDIIALVTAGFTAILLYTYTQQYKKVKIKYDSLRHDIMDNIGAVICNCHEQCNCKEEYVREMDEKGIDLTVR